MQGSEPVNARRWLAVTVVLTAALAAGCAGTPRADTTSAPATAPATASKAAGQRSTTLLAAGDTAYDDGSPDQFARCYMPSWGRFRDRTYPAPGNHDYQTADARGYYDFF